MKSLLAQPSFAYAIGIGSSTRVFTATAPQMPWFALDKPSIT